MKKLVITLMILATILTSQSAISIYTNDINSKVITYQGQKYLSFDLESAKVLQARDIMLWDYESHMAIIEDELLEANQKLKHKTWKDKLKNYGIISLATIAVVEAIIISLK
jgi:hypothetical protein